MNGFLPISLIQPNADQPRKVFPTDHIRALADSIAAEGLLQPIVVRPIADGRFEIVAGECRWRAYNLLTAEGDPRFARIRADVREMTDRERDVAAIVENLQRKDVSALEEARALQRLIEQGMTPAELAKSTGAPEFKIRWRLSLLTLCPTVLKLHESGAIDLQTAQELARLPDEMAQTRMLQRINRGEIVGHRTLHNAIEAILTGATAMDLFGDAAPMATNEELAMLGRMEKRIEAVAGMVAMGWKDGECVVAAKVSRDRARLMADKLRATQTALRKMESDLRQLAAQASIVSISGKTFTTRW
jgi:ParB/RepB/Spo0J family partition protein